MLDLFQDDILDGNSHFHGQHKVGITTIFVIRN